MLINFNQKLTFASVREKRTLFVFFNSQIIVDLRTEGRKYRFPADRRKMFL